MTAGAVRVRVAALLHEYTDGADEIDVDVANDDATLGEVMDALDARFPGLAFRVIDEQDRVRRHMNVFVGEQPARDRESPVPAGKEIYIVGSLSGG